MARILRDGVLEIPGRAAAALPRLTPHDVHMLRLLAREALSLCAEDAKGVVGADPATFVPKSATNIR